MQQSLAIIPARAGSKRIPGKNIRMLSGKPLLEWTINNLKASAIFESIVVSTDSPEIAEIARKSGATVPFLRSEKNSGDFATTADVLTEVINGLKKKETKLPDLICCTYPCAILFDPEIYGEAQQVLASDPKLDCVLTVLRYSHPIQRAMVFSDGLLRFLNPSCLNTRTQDLPPSFHDAGQFYFFRRAAFERQGCLIGARCRGIILKPWEALDIDEEEDWVMMEILFESKNRLTKTGASKYIKKCPHVNF